MLEKTFDPVNAEARIYTEWEASGAFDPSKADASAEPFTIVIPPPNVTGSLHMGHALNNTLQDILCRFHRMRGKAVLWQPGMDHAGIATQMVVERQLAADGNEDRRSMGREAFVNRVWKWKEESGGQILNQLRRLGASCDWSRTRFTMDKGLSEAVLKVFVQLYEEGLLYKDKRLVNWDPKFETAISDLEVENKEVDGHFWHFKYPLEGGETYEFPIAFDDNGNPTEWETRDYISIATTRPETMLGDGAVAVHPSDKRYAPIVGKKCLLPLADRYIPIIADEYPDPDFGSGAVKITGAHDFNDYQVARRNDIPMYILMDTKGRMVDEPYVPEKYRCKDRFDVRKEVVADIDQRGLLIMVEDKKIMQPFGDRSGVVIEPMLTDQWYVNAEELAREAISSVESGQAKFIPENWSKTYFQWMRNIEPWCISRQLWWGHRIPAWYTPDGSTYVGLNEADARQKAEAEHGSGVTLVQDEDVLDTWFSSALWPFSTLGWPTDTPELAKHYPTSVLVTAFDIIFFWVARMMMMGLHFMKDEKGSAVIPFPEIYIHGLIVDEKGQKMSKSKGNGVDPLNLIDKFGADALRFALAAQAGQGRNVRISDQRVEGYRNFSTKLWNAARFTEMNACAVDENLDLTSAKETLSQWILSETATCARAVTEGIEAYRFNDAANAVYRFAWNVFCDWHLELAKPILQGPDGPQKDEVRAVTAYVLDQILILMHPFMPFVTEELWGARAKRDQHLIMTDWADADAIPSNESAANEINSLIDLITEVRSVRAEMNVPAGAKIEMIGVALSNENQALIDRHQDLIGRLARIETFSNAKEAPRGAIRVIHNDAVFALPLQDIIDVSAEKKRLTKEVAKIEKEVGVIDKKLMNEKFMSRAPTEIVEEQKSRRVDYQKRHAKLQEALVQLSDL
ncbi:MAG: valine--tRNA ligase [Pseudomonadota bacterium]